jgi:hypothetical protein
MGDKTAKSKQPTLQQKSRAKAEDESKAELEQNGYSQTKILGVRSKG